MKIVLATDGTKHGEAAVRMLTRLSLKEGDVVKVISVVDMALPPSVDMFAGYLPETSELEKAARQHAENTVESVAETLQNFFVERKVEVETDVLFGSPDSRIVETAEEMAADLIVIGSHGYKRWERLLLGSVSDSVVHHAHCSVLIVRTPDPS